MSQNKVSGPSRRSLLVGGAAASTAALISPVSMGEMAENPSNPIAGELTNTMRAAISFLFNNFGEMPYRFSYFSQNFSVTKIKNAIANPSSISIDSREAKAFSDDLQLYCGTVKFLNRPEFSDIRLGEFTSATWKNLCAELRSEGLFSKNSMGRGGDGSRLAGNLSDLGYTDPNQKLSEIANELIQKCQATSRYVVSASYSKDPMSFISDFRAFGTGEMFDKIIRAGTSDSEKYKAELYKWIPEPIVDHIRTLCTNRTLEKLEDGNQALKGRMFPLGLNGAGKLQFHLALDAKIAQAALAALLPEGQTTIPQLTDAKEGGLILTLSPSEYKWLPKFTELMPESVRVLQEENRLPLELEQPHTLIGAVSASERIVTEAPETGKSA